VIRNHLSKKGGDYESDMSSSKIVNEAEWFFLEEERKSERLGLVAQRRELKREMEYVGEMSYEELREEELIHELETHVKRVIEEAEAMDGDSRSKRICDKLDWWIKSQVKAVLRLRHYQLYR
jgi:hypothetical protein